MARDLSPTAPAAPEPRSHASHDGNAGAAWRSDRQWLAPLLVLFLVKGLLLTAAIGPFTGHDEVDHFYYVVRLARGDGLGVVGAVELPPEAAPYRAYVADYPYNAEVIQPPLYHLLLVPLYWLIPGDDLVRLYAMRVISVGLGLAVVWLAYRTARLIFPDDILIRAGVPLFIAFQPQFAFVAAIVNHDVLVIALSSLLLYLTLRWLRDGLTPGRLVWLGGIAAAGLWTKANFGLALPVVAAAIVLRWRQDGGEQRALGTALARACGLPLLLVSPWWVRSFILYGDPTGAQRLREISDFGEQASSLGEMLFSAVFWRGRLEDFWGNYGWRLVPLDPGTYQLIYTCWGLSALGLAVLGVRTGLDRSRGRAVSLSRFQWQALALSALWIGLLVAGVLYVGTIQFTQSRFAFPGMIAFGVLTLVGYSALLPRRVRPAFVPAVLTLLLALTVWTSLRFLLPFYYGDAGATPLTQ